MLIKHMPCSLSYILGKGPSDPRRPEVLYGDPSRLEWRLNDTKLSRGVDRDDLRSYKSKFESAGVISFSHDESRALRASPETLRAVLDDFRARYTPGFRANETESVYVLHQEYEKDAKGRPILKSEPRLAVHFHFAKQHLPTGRYYAPYFWKRDRPRVEALQDYLCARHGLESANWTKRPASVSLRDTKRGLHETIESKLMDRLARGEIRDRWDVIKALQSDGYTVTVRSHKFLSIETTPGKFQRLKGLLYETGGPEKLLAAGITEPGTTMHATERPSLEELEKRLGELNVQAEACNLKKYAPRPARPESHKPELPTTREGLYGMLTPSARRTFDRLDRVAKREGQEVEEISREMENGFKEIGSIFGRAGIRALCKSADERRIMQFFAWMREDDWRRIENMLRKAEEHAKTDSLFYGGVRPAAKYPDR